MMSSHLKNSLERFILSALENIPIVSFYAKTRGWPFVIAWIHRICGILVFFYIGLHIYTLSLLATPVAYDAKMNLFSSFPFVVLEWLLAVPVIFHAFNGGRLILYEIFGIRKDESMIRWVLALSTIFILLLGLLMVWGNQTVSPVFFWLIMLAAGILPSYLVASKTWNVAAAIAWKLQRISGAYLIVMIPAHLLFMHLQPAVGHEAGIVIARMQNDFIQFVDMTLVIGVLYHAGYGLTAIIRDYLRSSLIQTGLVLLFLMIAVLAWIGIKLTLLML